MRKLKLPYLRKSHHKLALYFLSLFWNYPARSKDKVWEKRKNKEKKTKNSDEKFQTVSGRFPLKTNEEKQKTKKKK